MNSKAFIIVDRRYSKSLKRYTKILFHTLKASSITFGNESRIKTLLFKYLILPIKVLSLKNCLLVLPTENYSFLTIFAFRCRTLVVIHDVHDLINRETPWYLKCHYKLNVFCSQFATLILSVSAHTKEDVTKLWPAIGSRINILHNPIEDFWFTQDDEQVLHLQDVNKPFILLVGRNAWYKNYNLIYENINLFKDFLIVRIGDGVVSKHDNLITIPNVSDNQLKWLYRNAHCLLFPSIHEGFGWPILECMAVGGKVIAGKNSSIPEVGGNAIHYTDVKSCDALLASLWKLRNDKEYVKALSEMGRVRAREFSMQVFERKLNELCVTL